MTEKNQSFLLPVSQQGQGSSLIRSRIVEGTSVFVKHQPWMWPHLLGAPRVYLRGGSSWGCVSQERQVMLLMLFEGNGIRSALKRWGNVSYVRIMHTQNNQPWITEIPGIAAALWSAFTTRQRVNCQIQLRAPRSTWESSQEPKTYLSLPLGPFMLFCRAVSDQ